MSLFEVISSSVLLLFNSGSLAYVLFGSTERGGKRTERTFITLVPLSLLVTSTGCMWILALLEYTKGLINCNSVWLGILKFFEYFANVSCLIWLTLLCLVFVTVL